MATLRFFVAAGVSLGLALTAATVSAPLAQADTGDPPGTVVVASGRSGQVLSPVAYAHTSVGTFVQQLRGRPFLVTEAGSGGVTKPGALVSGSSCGDFMVTRSGADVSWRDVATGETGIRPVTAGRTYGGTTSTGWIEQETSTGAAGAATLTLHQVDAMLGTDTVVAAFSDPKSPATLPRYDGSQYRCSGAAIAVEVDLSTERVIYGGTNGAAMRRLVTQQLPPGGFSNLYVGAFDGSSLVYAVSQDNADRTAAIQEVRWLAPSGTTTVVSPGRLQLAAIDRSGGALVVSKAAPDYRETVRYLREGSPTLTVSGYAIARAFPARTTDFVVAARPSSGAETGGLYTVTNGVLTRTWQLPQPPLTVTPTAAVSPGRVSWIDDRRGNSSVWTRDLPASSADPLGPERFVGRSQAVAADGRRTAIEGASLDATIVDDAEQQTAVPYGARPGELSGHRVSARSAGFFDLATQRTGGSTDSRWGDLATSVDPQKIVKVDVRTGVSSTWLTPGSAGLPAGATFRHTTIGSDLLTWTWSGAGETGFARHLSWLNLHTGQTGTLPDLGEIVTYPVVAGRWVGAVSFTDGRYSRSVFDTTAGASAFTASGAGPLALGDNGVLWSDEMTGEGKFTPLASTRDAPVHEGNPLAKTSWSPFSGSPWTAELAFTQPLTSCSVTVSTAAGAPVRTLPCASRWMRYGEGVVGWDGRDATGSVMPKGSYRWSVNASGEGGAVVASSGSGALTGALAVEDDRYVALTPRRLTPATAWPTPVPGGFRYDFPVQGQAGVPDSASTVVLNLTIDRPGQSGHATLYPSDTARPGTSNVNFGPLSPSASQVVTQLGANGNASVYVSGPVYARALVDVAGYYTKSPKVVGLTPTRLLDTRRTVRVPARGTIEVQVAGQAGVPGSGAAAAALSVTSVGSTGAGHLTLWPTGAAQPNTSNVNYGDRTNQAGLAISRLGAGGKVSIYSSRATDVLVDVTTWFGATSDLRAATPARIVDTRLGLGAPRAVVAAGKAISIQLTGRGGVPTSGVKAVLLNVTAVRPTRGGHLSVYPTGSSLPNTSNLNFATGQTVANSVLAKVGTGGKVEVYSSAGSDVVVDVQGWILG